MKTATIQKVALRWTQILALGPAALTPVHTFASASASELDSIQFWTGTGTNRAAW